MAVEKKGPGLILRLVTPSQLTEVVACSEVTTEIFAEMCTFSLLQLMNLTFSPFLHQLASYTVVDKYEHR